MIKLNFGQHMAFGVPNMHEASKFYEEVMGFKVTKRHDSYIEMETGLMKIYLVSDNVRQPTFELLTADPDQSTEYLEHHGCLVDERMSQDSGEPVVRDPYGYIWLISKEKP